MAKARIDVEAYRNWYAEKHPNFKFFDSIVTTDCDVRWGTLDGTMLNARWGEMTSAIPRSVVVWCEEEKYLPTKDA
jgi:hypothetical protein